MIYTALVSVVVLTALVAASRRDRGARWRPWATACGVSLVAACALALGGCPLPPADGCTPLATRCSPHGVPQRCSASQRWSAGTVSTTCPAPSVCCLARSPWDASVHACVPQSACLDADGGAR